MKITAEPRSDQFNADDLVGGERTFTIADVKVGVAEQKYDITLAGEERVWRPPVTMLRLLIGAWGDESEDWVGRRVTLFRDPTVTFGKDTPGGIRISHLSHISKPFTMALTATRGKRRGVTVDPLPDAPAAPAPKAPSADAIVAAFEALGVSVTQLEAKVGSGREGWHTDDLTALAELGKAIKSGKTTVAEAFPDTPPDPPPSVRMATDDQLLDLAQAAEQKFGKGPKAVEAWRKWVDDKTGRTVPADNDLTWQEAGDLLALAAETEA